MKARMNITPADLSQDESSFVVSIIEEGRGFAAIIGRYQDFVELKIGARDITVINSGLNQASESLVAKLKTGVDLNDLSFILLHPESGLAARGHSALNSIFGSSVKRIEDALGSSEEPPIVEFCSDTFLIPWELMYSRSPSDFEEISLASVVQPFWGFNKIVSRRRLRGKVERKRVITRPPRVALLCNETLEFAVRERTWLRESHEQGRLQLLEFFIDPNWSLLKFPKMVSEFLNTCKADIVHFACHGEAVPGDEWSSYLELAPERRYLLGQLDWDPPVDLGGALVFLNACSTGIRNPAHTFSFVQKIWGRGASNIVAVESAIQSQLAEEFSRIFYEKFLDGESLGRAVFLARRKIMAESSRAANILALFYSLYATPDLRLGAGGAQ